MPQFLAGLVIFFGIHLLPLARDVRARLIGRFGEAAYKIVFSLLSALGLYLVVTGRGQVPFTPLYAPPGWGAPLAKGLMLPALVLLVAAYLPCNIRRVVHHPMLLGILLWSVGHLAANGDLGSVLLFGSFGLYAIVDGLASMRRESPTQVRLPFWRDGLAVVGGLLVYGLVFHLHGRFIAPLA